MMTSSVKIMEQTNLSVSACVKIMSITDNYSPKYLPLALMQNATEINSIFNSKVSH